MGLFANYRDSFKHPGSKYIAEVCSMSPADLQRLEADLRRQETTFKVSQASLTATAAGMTAVSLIHAGAVAGASALVSHHRGNCAHEKLELVRRVMQDRGIPTLPESFKRDMMVPIVLGTAPSIVSGGIDFSGHAATMVPIPSSAAAHGYQHVAAGAPLPYASGSGSQQIVQGVVNGAQHEMLVLQHPGHYVPAATGTPLYHMGYSGGEYFVNEAAQQTLGTGVPWAVNWVDERLDPGRHVYPGGEARHHGQPRRNF
ncbi:hypothetical protein C8R45DRAFT_926981 [Mycena sanguinolenta]|nr:hypothetical protein C8R45DRAFT_926981 [Mycena sanguinolenta]